MKFITALCGGASLLAMASPVLAQQAPAPAASAAAAPGTQLEVVVVTGSRIVRNGYSAPTPMTVAPIEQLQDTVPSSIPNALNKELPQFAGSTTTAGNSSAGGTPSVFGGNYLNLRNFGSIRTLILLDGRRVPPTAINGGVDSNILPQMLVERVDVVTGGASAVYGSDAVTGVVNFVLDKHYNGLKFVAQAGTSTYGDANSNRVGIAGGGKVTDRGHFIFSVERYQDFGISAHENRAWAAAVPDYVGAGTATSPFVLIDNARLNNATYGGLVTKVAGGASPTLLNQQFLDSGALGAFNPGTPTATSTINIGGDGAYYKGLNLSSPSITNQAFGRFEYELTNDISAFAQVGYAENQLPGQHSLNSPATALTIFNGNPYIPASVQSLLGPSPGANFTISRLNRDLANDATQYQKVDALQFTTGLTGSLLDRFKWDAYYTHGASIVRSTVTNNINQANLYAAVDAVKDSSGNIVCNVSITNPGLYPGCAPIDLLGTSNVSAAAKAFIYKNTQFEAVNMLDDYEANISGVVFNDWAGPVSLALNAEYRNQSLVETSNADPISAPSLTGIRGVPVGNAAPATIWAYAVQGPNHGKNSVWETSAETVVPLLTNERFAKNLEVTGAIRYTDYSSSGAVQTWKYGANYQPIEDLRIRWTESQDIRAPTLNDLYSGTAVSLVSVNDPHTHTTGVVRLITGGNPNLVPEVARTTTVGFVYSPSFIPRLRMSVDYYKITIANAIGTINGTQSAVLQECEDSGGTSPVCSSAVRPLPFSNTSAANFPTYVTNYSLNAAQTYTHGIDTEASYNFNLSDLVHTLPGRVTLRMLYAYQPELVTQSYPGAQITQTAGTGGFSAHRVNLTFNYKVGPLTFNWQTRYNSPTNMTNLTTQYYANNHLPAADYHDLSVNYTFQAAGHQTQLFLTVNNITDRQPRISPATNFAGIPGFSSGAVGGDDPIGRYYTAGLRLRY